MINYLTILFLLIYSSYTDIKTKEVSNNVCLLGLLISFLISLTNLIPFFTYLSIGFGIFYLLWRFGGFGGGDTKLFIIIGTLFQSLDLFFLFILTGILFIGYNTLSNKKEKRLVPFMLISFILIFLTKIILFI